MNMRLGLISLMACAWLTLSGCSTLRTLPPADLVAAHKVTVFSDGFHTGLLLDKAALPADFDPHPVDEIAARPFITVHFGEERWTSGADNSWTHALGLVFIPGPGVVQSDHTRQDLGDVPGLEMDKLRVWVFPVNQAGNDRMVAQLQHEWMTGIVMTRREGEASSLYLSPQSWSVFNSCHDFTIDLLRAAGLDIRGRWLYLAGGMATDLDEAETELRAAGITVIGIEPAPPGTARLQPGPAAAQ